ncbi:hypothetical protein EC973_001581 [Apophysomyces ossiformis]|uniref:Cytochrome P450 n=1 Tax=Apophysomyces ossiformis TaxID=679940 RepID=A0A8H7BNU1_9FUNG|nr:hypothetical protein EC973_001581 [Apophysomyces ossiformis]
MYLFRAVNLASKVYQWKSSRNLLSLAIPVAYSLYIVISCSKSRQQHKKSPPKVAFSLPLFGHNLYMLFFSSRFLDWCTETYGELFDLNLMGKTVTIASGQCALEVLKADHRVLSTVEGTIIGKLPFAPYPNALTIVYADILHLDYIIDRTVLDMLHKEGAGMIRRTIVKSNMPELMERMIAGFDYGLGCFASDSVAAPIGDPIHFFRKLTTSMAAPCLFGREVGSDPVLLSSLPNFIVCLMKNTGCYYLAPRIFHRFLTPFLFNVQYYFQIGHSRLQPIIYRRRAKMAEATARRESHNLEMDILQRLLECVKSDGTQYNDEEITQSLMVLSFVAVHVTSSNMAMTFYWLLARPDLKKRLEMEIKEILGDGPITEEGLDKMEFLNSFLHETLRHSQDIVSNRKKALMDFNFINGYQILKGCVIETANRQLNMGLYAGASTAEKFSPSITKGHLLTRPTKKFVTFGVGKNVCPVMPAKFRIKSIHGGSPNKNSLDTVVTGL